MPKFFDDVLRLPGRDKLNIYVLLIAKLSAMDPDFLQDKVIIKSIVSEVKVLFHNHEQKLASLVFILQQNLKQSPGISDNLKLALVDVINALQDDSLQRNFTKNTITKDDLHCQAGRIFESHLTVNMLLNPGENTLACVKKVSKNIIEYIKLNSEKQTFKRFLDNLGPDEEDAEGPCVPFGFGRFSHRPTIHNVIEVLQEHQNFPRIMAIHFMFMRDAYTPGKTDDCREEFVKNTEYKGDLGQYKSSNAESRGSLTMFLLNHHNYAPHLYKDRGRGPFLMNRSNRLGICLTRHDRNEFPTFETTWYPDCICQEAKLQSPYLQSLVRHDIPYVAGSSGMTSVVCTVMLLFGQFATYEEHQHYILAIMAFISGGGLHSIHEVLTVPHVRLGLLDSYRPFGEQAGNYNEFFNLFPYDETVQGNIKNAWSKTIEWVCKRYPELLEMNTSVVSNHHDTTPNPPENERCCTLF